MNKFIKIVLHVIIITFTTLLFVFGIFNTTTNTNISSGIDLNKNLEEKEIKNSNSKEVSEIIDFEANRSAAYKEYFNYLHIKSFYNNKENYGDLKISFDVKEKYFSDYGYPYSDKLDFVVFDITSNKELYSKYYNDFNHYHQYNSHNREDQVTFNDIPSDHIIEVNVYLPAKPDLSGMTMSAVAPFKRFRMTNFADVGIPPTIERLWVYQKNIDEIHLEEDNADETSALITYLIKNDDEKVIINSIKLYEKDLGVEVNISENDDSNWKKIKEVKALGGTIQVDNLNNANHNYDFKLVVDSNAGVVVRESKPKHKLFRNTSVKDPTNSENFITNVEDNFKLPEISNEKLLNVSPDNAKVSFDVDWDENDVVLKRFEVDLNGKDLSNSLSLYQVFDNDNSSSKKHYEVNIKNLSSDTNYNFELRIYYNVIFLDAPDTPYNSSPSFLLTKNLFEITTPPVLEEPEAPTIKKVEAEATGSTTAKIDYEIEVPSSSNNEPTKINSIKVFNNGKEIAEAPNTNPSGTIKVDGLTPGKDYTFELRVDSNAGEVKNSTNKITTLESSNPISLIKTDPILIDTFGETNINWNVVDPTTSGHEPTKLTSVTIEGVDGFNYDKQSANSSDLSNFSGSFNVVAHSGDTGKLKIVAVDNLGTSISVSILIDVPKINSISKLTVDPASINTFGETNINWSVVDPTTSGHEPTKLTSVTIEGVDGFNYDKQSANSSDLSNFSGSFNVKTRPGDKGNLKIVATDNTNHSIEKLVLVDSGNKPIIPISQIQTDPFLIDTSGETNINWSVVDPTISGYESTKLTSVTIEGVDGFNYDKQSANSSDLSNFSGSFNVETHPGDKGSLKIIATDNTNHSIETTILINVTTNGNFENNNEINLVSKNLIDFSMMDLANDDGNDEYYNVNFSLVFDRALKNGEYIKLVSINHNGDETSSFVKEVSHSSKNLRSYEYLYNATLKKGKSYKIQLFNSNDELELIEKIGIFKHKKSFLSNKIIIGLLVGLILLILVLIAPIVFSIFL